MKNELMTVTPELAQEWLKKNCDNNRSIRYADVKKYARDIQNGDWKITHQGIAFDENGRLVDGQHRLSAIALADTPVQIYVATGVDEDAIKVMDSGATRTISDRMRIAGRDEVYRNKRVPAFINSVNFLKFGEADHKKLSTCEMEDAITRYYGACAYIRSLGNRPCSKSAVTVAVVSAMQTEWKSLVDAFVECVDNNTIGTGDLNWKAALTFADRLRESSNTRNGGLCQKALELEAEKAIYCFIHGKKFTKRSDTIYPLTKEQLEKFTH